MAGGVVFALLLVPGVLSQEQAPDQPPPQQVPTFRLEANFVRVDAYPTKGAMAVRDLTEADFEVFEDGVPQEIVTFEHVDIPGRVPADERREPSSVRQGRAMAEDPRARVFVVFLDTLNTSLFGSHRMQTALVTLLDRLMGPDDLFAVMTPHMSARDISLARKTTTVQGYLSKYWYWGERDLVYPLDPIERRLAECFPPTQGSTDPVSRLARELIDRRRETLVIDALEDLAVYLRGVREERKAVIAVTSGWLLPRENRELSGPGPRPGTMGVTPAGRLTADRVGAEYGISSAECEGHRQTLAFTDVHQRFLDLLAVANRSNVSFYPVDAGGLTAVDSDMGPGMPRPIHVDIARIRTRVEHLQTLAVETDGLAVINTNDIDRGLRRIVDDLTSYYLLGYYSSNAKLDGRFRKITVKVTRPGVSVRARRGYKAATAEELSPSPATTTAAVAPGVIRALAPLASLRSGAAVRTALSYVTQPKGESHEARLWAVVELDGRTARGAEWQRGGDVTLMVAGPDGAPIAQARRTFPAGQRSVSLPLGQTDLSSVAGSFTVRTRVTPAGDGVSVTETVKIAANAGGTAPRLWRRGPGSAMDYVPTAVPQFQRSDRIRMDLPLLRPSTVTADVLDRSGKPMALPVEASTHADGDLTWARAEIAVAPLAPGDYILRFSLTGEGAPIHNLTGFKVVP